jgi:hypothetical protein
MACLYIGEIMLRTDKHKVKYCIESSAVETPLMASLQVVIHLACVLL